MSRFVVWLCLLVLSVASTKDVSISVIKTLNARRNEAPYDHVVQVQAVDDNFKLIDVMETAQAAGTFHFEKEMHPLWGASITVINGLKANKNKKQYWQILGGEDLTPTALGASSYNPYDGENIVFKLVTWDFVPDEPTEET